MKRIDAKDRQILYQLDLNCRQSNTQIGKKVNLSKRVVSYRINKMVDANIIKTFWTAIDTFKLGYNVLRIYIHFQYMVEPDIKNEIINHFVNYQNAWVVGSDKGEIDLSLILWVNNNYEFYQFWNNTLDLYEDYFAKVSISLYIQAIDFYKSYLLKKDIRPKTTEFYRITCTKNCEQIDKIDYKILNELATNARIPLVELAKKIGCSSQDIKYRMNNLIKKEIIRAFRIHLDYASLGFRTFKVDIYLKKHKMLKPIVKYLRTKPYLKCLNIAVGWADIEPEIVIRNVDELTEILDDLNSIFPNSIRKYNYWINEKIYKERWLPEIFK